MKPDTHSANESQGSEDWVIFRVDLQTKEQPIDIYFVLDVSSNMLLSFATVPEEMLQQHADKLLSEAVAKKGNTPRKLLLANGEPASNVLREASQKLGVTLELVAASYIEQFTAQCKRYFGEQFCSPSTFAYTEKNEERKEEMKAMIQDSYDLCSCASGKKYKFCCKKILREITEAMVAAEDGNFSDALAWIAKAKKIVGDSAEVLCREAIVYSYFDQQKSAELLEKCLAINPTHPRAYYIHGITLKENGDFLGAIAAYEKAITYYPPTDHYHLNEAYNNLGGVFYTIGEVNKARIAWEKALLYMPKDVLTRRNIQKFIYNETDSVLFE